MLSTVLSLQPLTTRLLVCGKGVWQSKHFPWFAVVQDRASDTICQGDTAPRLSAAYEHGEQGREEPSKGVLTPRLKQLSLTHMQSLYCKGRKLIDPLSISDCPSISEGDFNLVDVRVEAS